MWSSQDCTFLPAQGERVYSTSVPLFLFSSLFILEFPWISSRSGRKLVLLAEYSFRLLVSCCIAVIPPLEKMPMTACLQFHNFIFFLWYCEHLRLGYFWANRVIILVSLLPYLMIPLCTASLTCHQVEFVALTFLPKPAQKDSFPSARTQKRPVSPEPSIFFLRW